MSEQSTPLPWTFTANSWQYTTIYDANDGAICRLDLEDWGVTEENQDVQEAEEARVAELIVKAVNNHDALVKAAEKAHRWFETMNDGEEGCNYMNGDSDKYPGNGYVDGEALQAELRAILALVGQPPTS